MSEPVVVEFFGIPIAKARAKSASIGDGKRVTYTPAKTRKFEAALTFAVRDALKSAPLLVGAVSLSVTASLPIPTSWSQKKQAAARAGKIWPTVRPDIDNFLKSAMDCCNAVAFADDKQVCFVTVSKRYSERPSLRIEIASMGRGEEEAAVQFPEQRLSL